MVAVGSTFYQSRLTRLQNIWCRRWVTSRILVLSKDLFVVENLKMALKKEKAFRLTLFRV